VRWLVGILIVVATLAAIGVFYAWGVAVWQPWGHQKEWQNTALLLLFTAIAAGGAAGLLKDFGRRS